MIEDDGMYLPMHAQSGECPSLPLSFCNHGCLYYVCDLVLLINLPTVHLVSFLFSLSSRFISLFLCFFASFVCFEFGACRICAGYVRLIQTRVISSDRVCLFGWFLSVLRTVGRSFLDGGLSFMTFLLTVSCWWRGV